MAILLSDSYKVINWDLNTKALDTSYWGKPTDSGRGCKVLLTQNGVAKTPSTETMRINFKKPSGLQIFLDGVISGNYFVFDFTEQVFAEQGEVMAELMLNVGGEWLMSSTFYIQVGQSFTSAIESSEEFTALQTALSNVNNFKTQILDVNGNEILKFGVTPNAVNEITIRNKSTGCQPVVEATGNDTNIGLVLRSKGIGTIIGVIGNSIGYTVKAIANTTSAVNYLAFGAGATTVSPTIEATGTDANIDINLVAKGTGGVTLNRVNFTEETTLTNIVSGESQATLWGKVKKMFSFIGTNYSTLAPAYSASSTYGVGAYVIYNTKLYRCTTAITVAEAFNVAKWTESNFIEWSSLKVSSSVVAGANITINASTLEKIGRQVFVNVQATTTASLANGGTILTIPVGYRIVGNPYTFARISNVPNAISNIQIQGGGNVVLADTALASGSQILFSYSYFTS